MAGDAILSRPEDEAGAPVRISVVEKVFRQSAPIVQLALAGQAVGTTAKRPFSVATKGWPTAKDEWWLGETLT